MMQVDLILNNNNVFKYARRWYALIVNNTISVSDVILDLKPLDNIFSEIDKALQNDPINHLDFSRKSPYKYKIEHAEELERFLLKITKIDLYYQKAFRLRDVGAIKNNNDFLSIKELFDNVLNNSLTVMKQNALAGVEQ